MGNPSIFFRDDVDPANELNMEERCGLGWGILGHRSEMDGPETSRDKFLLHLLHMYTCTSTALYVCVRHREKSGVIIPAELCKYGMV